MGNWIKRKVNGESGGDGTPPDLSNYVTLNSNQSITGTKTFNSKVVLGTDTHFGYGGSPHISSDDRNNKRLYWTKSGYGYLQQDFNGIPRPLQNISNPEQPQDAANKQYVDTAITNLQNNIQSISNLLTTDTQQTINGNKTFTRSIDVLNPVNSTNAVNMSYVNPDWLTYDSQNQTGLLQINLQWLNNNTQVANTALLDFSYLWNDVGMKYSVFQNANDGDTFECWFELTMDWMSTPAKPTIKINIKTIVVYNIVNSCITGTNFNVMADSNLNEKAYLSFLYPMTQALVVTRVVMKYRKINVL